MQCLLFWIQEEGLPLGPRHHHAVALAERLESVAATGPLLSNEHLLSVVGSHQALNRGADHHRRDDGTREAAVARRALARDAKLLGPNGDRRAVLDRKSTRLN